MLNQLVFENLKHRPLRTLLSAAAIAIEVAMILTLVGLSDGTLDESKRMRRGIGADIVVRPGSTSVMSFSGVTLPEKLVEYFQQQPDVEIATGSAAHGIPGGLMESASGVDLAKFSTMSDGLRFLSGGPFQAPKDIIVDERYARTKQLGVGSTLKLWDKNWNVCGVVEPGKLSRVFLPLPVVQELASAPGKLSQIYIKLKDPSRTDAVVKALKDNPQLGSYQVLSIDELASLFSIDGFPALRQFISVVIGLGVVVGFLVVLLSMYTAVLERTREIGILKSLGASPAYIMGILMRETLILSITGAVAGIVLSLVTQWTMNTFGGSALVQKMVPHWWPYTTLLAIAGALLGTLYPAMKAVRHDALEALSYD
ncbi:MAG: FtsX-like permease family protein [Acidobacteria bacterium]|nr:FtsX-like permease family protein [Acidobacteriota bacterium]